MNKKQTGNGLGLFSAGKPLSNGIPPSVDTSLGRPDKQKMHAPVPHTAIPVVPQSIFEQYQDRLLQYSLMAKGVLFTDQETKTTHILQEMFERYGIPEDRYRVYFTLIDIRETLPQDPEFIDNSGNALYYFCSTLIEDSQEAERAYNFIAVFVKQWYLQRPDTE